MISRRLFLVISGSAFLAPHLSWASEKVPAMLDHILLGCRDLDSGVAFVEGRTGVRASYGGVHPGRGTRNALLSLGERRYLEIIAPDPKQKDLPPSAVSRVTALQGLTSPRLVGWAAHTSDIEALAGKLRGSGIALEAPRPGSRTRDDGRVLSWKALGLADDHHGLLPFFIEWASTSPHPSVDAPSGCHLERFVIVGPNPGGLSKLVQSLGIDVPVARSETSQLQARFTGPKGRFEVTS